MEPSKNSSTESAGFVAWHPRVHEHFNARLFFFLLAVTPAKVKELHPRLRELLKSFGVETEAGHEGYCLYEVLGEFDHLLRVWLSPHIDAKFIQAAREKLPVETMLPFSVQRVVSDWRFASELDPAELASLDTARIAAVQMARSEKDAEEFRSTGIARWVSQLCVPEVRAAGRRQRTRRTRIDKAGADDRTTVIDPVKAFICLQPPSRIAGLSLDNLQTEIIDYVNSDANEGIGFSTFHHGVGFAWMLVKVVARNFDNLKRLIRGLTEEFGGRGVSTSTYAAIAHLAEGDGVSIAALRAHNVTADQIDARFPGLRAADEKNSQLRKGILAFIEEKVLPTKLDDESQTALRLLLEAAANGREEHAMQALYLPTVMTERDLRGRILELAGRSGGVVDLFRRLNELGLSVKSPETMSLGICLTATRLLIQHEIPAEEINGLTKVRNRVMHGASIDLRKEWRELADYLLIISHVRTTLISALDERLRSFQKS